MKGKLGPRDGKLARFVAPFVFIGLLLVLVLVNVKHSMLCASGGESAAEAALKRQALDRRLLALEQETLQNNALFEKLIRRLDAKFELTKGVSIRELKDQAHLAGLSVSAILAEEPAPPMPSFESLYPDAKGLNDAIDGAMGGLDDYAYNLEREELEEPYEQQMELVDDLREANAVDDLFRENQGVEGGEMSGGESFGGGAVDDVFRDKKADFESPFDDPPKIDPIPEAQARPQCMEWKKQYRVQPGVSWGSLPYDLQDKWKLYECDSYTLNEFGF